MQFWILNAWVNALEALRFVEAGANELVRPLAEYSCLLGHRPASRAHNEAGSTCPSHWRLDSGLPRL